METVEQEAQRRGIMVDTLLERMPSEPFDNPAAIEQERVPEINLQVVPSYQSPGRPLFLTPRRFISIVKLIERGSTIIDACRALSVGYSAFRKHTKRTPAYQRRLAQALEERDTWLKEFHIGNLTRASVENSDISKFWLERRFPGEFSLREVNRPVPLGERLLIASHVITVSDAKFEELSGRGEYKMLEAGTLERVIGGLRTVVMKQAAAETRL